MNHKKKVNKQTVLGIVCLVISGLIMFVAVPLVAGIIGNNTEIVRVTKTIRVGDAITKENSEVVEVSGYNLPSGVIKNHDDALNQYVTAKLEPGDYVLESKIVSNMINSDNYMSALNGEKRIISVTIKDLASGVSGKLTAGDIVTILNNAEAPNNRSTSYNELKYVKVLTVTTTEGIDAGGETISGEEQLPATVTLLVNEVQGQLLSGLEKNGNIYFELVYPGSGDAEIANEFIKKQDNYFTKNGSI